MTVKEMRKKTGMTQQKFAEILEIPVEYISRWEQGRATPPDYVLNLIEKVLWYIGLL